MKFSEIKAIIEGKSFKRNKDEDADKKKKDDQQRRDSRKREPVEESSNIKKGAFHKWLGKSEDEKITQADIKKGLASNDEHVRKMAQFAKNMEESVEMDEGKSFKRNDDDSKSKKQKDEERKKARDDKRKRTDEGWVRVYDKKELTTALKAKYGDQLSAHKMPSNTVQYMINGIKTVGMWDGMMKQGKMLESVSQSTLKIDEAIQSPFDFLHDPTLLNRQPKVAAQFDDKKAQMGFNRGFKSAFGGTMSDTTGMTKEQFPFYDKGLELGKAARKAFGPNNIPTTKVRGRFDELKDNPAFVKICKVEAAKAWSNPSVQSMLSGGEVSEAADISFNDAKAELPHVKDRLGKMNPFHPDYVKTKARHDKLQDRLSRMKDDDELDEASDLSFNDAKAQLPGVKDRLSKMSPFHPDYIKTKSHHDKLQDRLSRMKDDDEMDEAMDQDCEHELDEAPLQVGDHIAYTFAHSSPPKTFTGTIKAMQGDKIKIQWDEENGHYAGPSEQDCQDNGIVNQIYNMHWAKKTDVEESYVDDTSGYGGDTMDVCEDGEEHDHEVGEDVIVTSGKYTGMEGKVAKIGPGPYKVVQLKGGKQVRLENSEMKCATSESYVSGDDTSGSDDVIEDLNMEDFVMPRDQAHDLADEVETKKDGHPVSPSEIERMKQLAGLNKI